MLRFDNGDGNVDGRPWNRFQSPNRGNGISAAASNSVSLQHSNGCFLFVRSFVRSLNKSAAEMNGSAPTEKNFCFTAKCLWLYFDASTAHRRVHIAVHNLVATIQRETRKMKRNQTEPRRKKKIWKTKTTTMSNNEHRENGNKLAVWSDGKIFEYCREGWMAQETTESTRCARDAHLYAPLPAVRGSWAARYSSHRLLLFFEPNTIPRGKTQNSRRGGWRKAMSVAVLPQTICVCSLVNKYSNMLLVYAADFIYLRTEKKESVEHREQHHKKTETKICCVLGLAVATCAFQTNSITARAHTKCAERHSGATLNKLKKTMCTLIFRVVSGLLWILQRLYLWRVQFSP